MHENEGEAQVSTGSDTSKGFVTVAVVQTDLTGVQDTQEGVEKTIEELVAQPELAVGRGQLAGKAIDWGRGERDGKGRAGGRARLLVNRVLGAQARELLEHGNVRRTLFKLRQHLLRLDDSAALLLTAHPDPSETAVCPSLLRFQGAAPSHSGPHR